MDDTPEHEKPPEKNPSTPEDIYLHLSDEDIRQIVESVRSQDSDTVHAVLDDLGPADAAELLAKISDDDRRELLSMYSDALDPEMFTEMDPELTRISLSSMPAAQVARMISELETDDALLLIQPLEDDFQQEVIKKLSAKTRVVLEEGLNFPEKSAGRLMRRELVAIPESWTVGKTIDYLRAVDEETMPEHFFDIFLINPSHHLTGEVPINRILRSKRTTKLKDLTLEEMHPVPADMHQESVAHLFRREDLLSAPVVDSDNRLIGMITIDDVVDVIDEEAQEDILRLAGVDQGDLYRAVISTAGTRFRWLFINLLTAILASIVISFFDATIEEVVALAVLMPIVASMGGNAGTQALAVSVRAIATRELSDTNKWRVIWKETLVGTLNGFLFAVMMGFLAGLWFQSPVLGAVIGAAMIINLIAAGLSGASIPLILHKMGHDPAVSSSIFLTTVTDVIGFFAFLGLAAVFLV